VSSSCLRAHRTLNIWKYHLVSSCATGLCSISVCCPAADQLSKNDANTVFVDMGESSVDAVNTFLPDLYDSLTGDSTNETPLHELYKAGLHADIKKRVGWHQGVGQ
jgi:hypothetical protein